tara:strand:- start:775 stop:1986 length:1212 start_codon:yes stop_codon:yes gene_type:complete
MSGFLDSKTRMIDAVVTQIGRQQIASGMLKVEYASFTDAYAYYEADEASGSSDARDRIYFEAAGDRRQDFVTFETDDSGNLLGYPTDPKISLVGGELFKSDVSASVSDIGNFIYVSGAGDFGTLSSGIVTSSIDHFKQLRIIGSTPTTRPEDLKQKFELNQNNFEFIILNTHPFNDGPSDSQADINSVEPLFIDKRLSHIPNYKFLPPLVTEPNLYNSEGEYTGFDLEAEQQRQQEGKQVFLGSYEAISETLAPLTYEDLMIELNGEGSEGLDPDYIMDFQTAETITAWNQQGTDGSGSTGDVMGTVFGQQAGVINLSTLEVARDRKYIYFDKTSEDNNLVMQMFEVDSNRLNFLKLDVIDYGEIIVTTDEIRSNKHIFFAGKVFLDSNNIPTFVNLFTIIMD